VQHIRISESTLSFKKVPQDALDTQPYYSRALFEANSDAIVVTDTYGIISDVNKEMVEISGWTRSDLIGSNWFDLVNNKVQAGIEYTRTLTDGRVSDVELVVQNRDGTETPVLYNAAPIYDCETNLVGVFATLRNTSDLKRLKRDLAAKNYEVSRANQMKSEFIATMSHELRTPLTAILGFSEALLCGILGNMGDEQREYIQDIHDSGQHLLKLISDILDLAKIDAGMMELHMEAADLTDVLAHTVIDTNRHLPASRIEMEIDFGDRASVSQLDLHKTQKIIDHMLSNAVKFSAPSGKVRIHACRVPRSAVGLIRGRRPVFGFPLSASDFSEFLQITVHDDGIGISPQKLPQVFQIFNQIDGGLERRFEGVGLGASMVQRLAELQEGTTAIASLPGKGTTIAVWLPIRDATLNSSTRARLTH
jgi:hypothetical protein